MQSRQRGLKQHKDSKGRKCTKDREHSKERAHITVLGDTRQHKKIWITRPIGEAISLSTSLQTLGYSTIVEPLLKIRHKHVKIDVQGGQQGCQAVIFTSANGVKAYGENGGSTQLPAYVVGSATACQATQVGFQDIHVAKGDVVSLCDMIQQSINPFAGALYHASGSVVAKDICTLLPATYTVHRQVLYEAVPIARLRESFCQQVKKSLLCAVVLLSPRTASIFCHMVNTHALNAYMSSVKVFALSDSVARNVRDLPCKIYVATEPTQQNIIGQIQKHLR